MKSSKEIFITVCAKSLYQKPTSEQARLRNHIHEALKDTQYKTHIYNYSSGFLYVAFHNMRYMNEHNIVYSADLQLPDLTFDLVDQIGIFLKLGIPLNAIQEQNLLYDPTRSKGDEDYESEFS